MLADDLKKAAAELAEHRQRILPLQKVLTLAPRIQLYRAAEILAAEIHITALLVETAVKQLPFMPEKKQKP